MHNLCMLLDISRSWIVSNLGLYSISSCMPFAPAFRSHSLRPPTCIPSLPPPWQQACEPAQPVLRRCLLRITTGRLIRHNLQTTVPERTTLLSPRRSRHAVVCPSWLAYDATTRMLSCSGEAMYGSGSISSLSADSGGRLTVTGKAQAPTGGLSCPWARTYSYIIVLPVWRTQVGIEVGFV